jgi:hypothetical protein
MTYLVVNAGSVHVVYLTVGPVRLTLKSHACKVVLMRDADSGPGEREIEMSNEKRAKGKIIRKVAKLDRTWRQEGKAEGRTENELARTLGVAARAGLGEKSREAQNRNAIRLGAPMDWPMYGV